MKKIVYTFVLLHLHIIAEENFTKATFQAISSRDFEGNIITFYNEDNVIKASNIIGVYNQNYLTKSTVAKELFIPPYTKKSFFEKPGWKHVLYDSWDSPKMVTASSHDIFVYGIIPTEDAYTGQLTYSSIINAKKPLKVKAHSISSHNSPLATIQNIIDKNAKSYVFSSSICPSIKASKVILDNPSKDNSAPLFQINSIECNGNQCYLLGADYRHIIYAYVKGARGYFSCLFNSKKHILNCAIAAKEITNFEDEGVDFKKNRQNETIQNTEFNLSIDLRNLPLVVFNKHPYLSSPTNKIIPFYNYAVLYNPADNNLLIIDPQGKKIFKKQVSSNGPFCSLAVLFLHNDEASKPSIIQTYLLCPDSKAQKEIVLKKIIFNVKNGTFENEEKVMINKKMSSQSSIIGIAQFTKNNTQQLLCVSNKGKAYIIDLASNQEIDYIPITPL